MKSLTLLVFTLFFAANSNAEDLFTNLDSYVTSTSNQTILKGSRILSLFSRMSVYAMLCGSQEDNAKFSRLYKSNFTEQNRGMVTYEAQTFTNPIETMRNKAMLEFMKAEGNGGREQLCAENRMTFTNLINSNMLAVEDYVASNR